MEAKISSPTEGENTKTFSGTDLLHTPNLLSREIDMMPWWTEELTALKREVKTKKKRVRNAAAAVRRGKVVEEYLEAKRRYKTEVMKAYDASLKEDRQGPESRPEEGCHREDREKSDNDDDKL